MSGDTQPDQMNADPVGDQLRRAREGLGLSVSAIADEQHLRPSVIQSIESGDYSKIDSELFLKGYVRAYARQVGLNGDAIIADLNRELEPVRQQKEAEQQANPLVSIERKKKRKRQVARILAVLLVFAAAIYLIAGYLADRDAELAPPAPSEVPAEPGVQEGDGAEMGNGAELAMPEEAELATIDRPSAEEPVDTVVGALPDPLLDDRVTEGSDDQSPDHASLVTQEPEPALQESQLLSAGEVTQGRLQIAFSDDCWVQVTDATGARLVSSLRRSGEQLDVTGEAPLTVVIGAVSAVESIRFQGEALSIGEFRVVNNRSEFTLEL